MENVFRIIVEHFANLNIGYLLAIVIVLLLLLLVVVVVVVV